MQSATFNGRYPITLASTHLEILNTIQASASQLKTMAYLGIDVYKGTFQRHLRFVTHSI